MKTAFPYRPPSASLVSQRIMQSWTKPEAQNHYREFLVQSDFTGTGNLPDDILKATRQGFSDVAWLAGILQRKLDLLESDPPARPGENERFNRPLAY